MNRNSLDSTVAPAARDEAQFQTYLLRLINHAEKQQAELEALSQDARERRDQLTALLHQLTEVKPAPGEEALAEFMAALSSHQEQLEALAAQLVKLNRTQFKTNSLAEAQGERLARAIAVLQEIVTRREAAGQAAETRAEARLHDVRAQARVELASELLPVLDGLEAALESGETLLKRHRRKVPPRGLWARLRGRFARRKSRAQEKEEDEPVIDAWLKGLKLVHERFLKLLALEHITSIEGLGEPFDPRQHVAVEAIVRHDVLSGTVMAVLRRGYRQGERVLRYAEVVVAQGRKNDDDD